MQPMRRCQRIARDPLPAGSKPVEGRPPRGWTARRAHARRAFVDLRQSVNCISESKAPGSVVLVSIRDP